MNYLPLREKAFSGSVAKQKINGERHKKNEMPKNPTMEERIKRHLDHQKHK